MDALFHIPLSSLAELANASIEYKPLVMIVNQYYQDIDQTNNLDSRDPNLKAEAEQAIKKVSNLYSEQAVYNRAGLKFFGRKQIEQFNTTPYPQGRAGFKGVHTNLQHYVLNSNRIVTRGVFIRTDGLEIPFADFWIKDHSKTGAKPTIQYRHTFLCDNVFENFLNKTNKQLAFISGTYALSSDLKIILGQVELEPNTYIDILKFENKDKKGESQILYYVGSGHEHLKPANS